MRRNRTLFAFAFLAAFALIVAACGSPTPTRTPAPSATSSVATEAATVAATEVATEIATAVATEVATEAPTQVLAATQAPTEAATAAPTEAAMVATEAATAVPTQEATAEMAATEAAMVATEAATAAATEAMAAATAAAEATREPLACQATGDLVVGTDAAFPPFESVDTATNEIVGFDMDLVKAIGDKSGFTPQFVNALYDTIFINLAAGEFHLVSSGSTITAARLQTVNFSNPYFVSAQAIVMRADEAATYMSVADLAGKTIGVQLGTTGAEAAKDIPDTAGISEYQTAPEAFQALKNGDVDAVVNDLPVSQSIVANNPELNVAIVDDAFTLEYYGIAVRKECGELLDAVNSGLAAIIADGTYADIYANYFGVQPSAAYQKGGQGLTLDEIMNPATPEPTAAPTEAAMAATEAATAVPTQEATAEMAATEAATAAATVAATVAATAAAEATREPLACQATGDLVVGTDAAFPPFESVDTATNEIVGFDMDLVKAIGDKSGFTPQFVNALYDTIFINLAAGEFHLVSSGSTITAARLQTVNFSNPYFVSAQAIVMRADEAATYMSVADLAGKTIGVQLGTTGAEAAKDIPDTAGISEYQTAPEAFQALKNGDVDAVVNDLPVSQSIVANNPELNVAIVDDAFTLEYYGIAVRKECGELLDAVNSGLAAIIADGTYADIYANYFGVQPSAAYQKGGQGLTLDEIMNPATPEPTTEATAEPTPEATPRS